MLTCSNISLVEVSPHLCLSLNFQRRRGEGQRVKIQKTKPKLENQLGMKQANLLIPVLHMRYKDNVFWNFPIRSYNNLIIHIFLQSSFLLKVPKILNFPHVS